MTSPHDWMVKEREEQIVRRFKELTKTESLKFLELMENVLKSCSVPVDIAKETAELKEIIKKIKYGRQVVGE